MALILPSDWRKIREALGITQRKMAELCYVTPQTIQNIEVGRTKPRPATLVFLRSVLQHPECQARLKRAGVIYPFPEDMA